MMNPSLFAVCYMANLSLCAKWFISGGEAICCRVTVEVSVYYMTNLSLCAR
jgi:hypothetical protein